MQNIKKFILQIRKSSFSVINQTGMHTDKLEIGSVFNTGSHGIWKS